MALGCYDDVLGASFPAMTLENFYRLVCCFPKWRVLPLITKHCRVFSQHSLGGCHGTPGCKWSHSIGGFSFWRRATLFCITPWVFAICCCSERGQRWPLQPSPPWGTCSRTKVSHRVALVLNSWFVRVTEGCVLEPFSKSSIVWFIFLLSDCFLDYFGNTGMLWEWSAIGLLSD